MKTKRISVAIFSSAVVTVAWSGLIMADAAGDAIGQKVAADLRTRYHDTRMSCTRYSAPGFTCNGVIFRATIPSPDYKFWDPSPKAKASGGWSYSYLRRDAKFKRLVRDENNGNIIFPPLLTPPDKTPVHVLCAFPEDGGTDTRDRQGCGVSTSATSDSRICHEQGIVNANQWLAKHKKDRLSNVNQCAFNVRDDANEKGTQSFEAFIEATGKDSDTFDQQNEFRLATWDSTKPETLPIQALFYLKDGLADAQFDQNDYRDATGTCLPIIKMTLPQSLSQDATFDYLPGDQKCSSTPAAEYIQSAEWVKRHDPGTGKDEWSLSITPTQLGKDAKADRTDAVLAELQRKFGNDPQWKNNDGGGMRRQLVCHYVIARDKSPWNLEPYRKDTSEAAAEAAGCNP
ncbi:MULTISPECIES: DUF2599 domain-containing protein [Pseudomonas]|uniref:DUF2599 domain-containing protein n=1 Tax=Pseudomonas TaxID=286 RepID=UPI001AE2FA3B|nr:MULTISPECIES: DUF2599 domain-containing protein [unclassified Pseudomonas]MBP1127948.1 hypothetical protein [Pseudomonas sp. PvP025]MDQ0396886.1 hypothetical protein [Pseudomonas sp. PvP006]